MKGELEYRLVRLFETSSTHIKHHFHTLSDKDRRLRFGHSPSNDMVDSYIDTSLAQGAKSRTHADFWFGVKIGVELVATMHVAIRNDTAEFAFTVDEQHRGKKLGQLLFARGYQLVSEYSIHKIFMLCLSENKAMQHIAKKFGMKLEASAGEIESFLNVDTHAPLPVFSLSEKIVF